MKRALLLVITLSLFLLRRAAKQAAPAMNHHLPRRVESRTSSHPAGDLFVSRRLCSAKTGSNSCANYRRANGTSSR